MATSVEDKLKNIPTLIIHLRTSRSALEKVDNHEENPLIRIYELGDKLIEKGVDIQYMVPSDKIMVERVYKTSRDQFSGVLEIQRVLNKYLHYLNTDKNSNQ